MLSGQTIQNGLQPQHHRHVGSWMGQVRPQPALLSECVQGREGAAALPGPEAPQGACNPLDLHPDPSGALAAVVTGWQWGRVGQAGSRHQWAGREPAPGRCRGDGWGEPTICGGSKPPARASLPYWNSFTKHKFKENFIKNFKTETSRNSPQAGALLSLDPIWLIEI